MGSRCSPKGRRSEPDGLLDCTRQGEWRISVWTEERKYTGAARKEDQVNSYICADDIGSIRDSPLGSSGYSTNKIRAMDLSGGAWLVHQPETYQARNVKRDRFHLTNQQKEGWASCRRQELSKGLPVVGQQNFIEPP